MKVHAIALLVAVLIFGVAIPTLCAQSDFIRGDCNIDGRVDVGDAFLIIQYAFIDGAPPPCQAACAYLRQSCLDDG